MSRFLEKYAAKIRDVISPESKKQLHEYKHTIPPPSRMLRGDPWSNILKQKGITTGLKPEDLKEFGISQQELNKLKLSRNKKQIYDSLVYIISNAIEEGHPFAQEIKSNRHNAEQKLAELIRHIEEMVKGPLFQNIYGMPAKIIKDAEKEVQRAYRGESMREQALKQFPIEPLRMEVIVKTGDKKEEVDLDEKDILWLFQLKPEDLSYKGSISRLFDKFKDFVMISKKKKSAVEPQNAEERYKEQRRKKLIRSFKPDDVVYLVDELLRRARNSRVEALRDSSTDYSIAQFFGSGGYDRERVGDVKYLGRTIDELKKIAENTMAGYESETLQPQRDLDPKFLRENVINQVLSALIDLRREASGKIFSSKKDNEALKLVGDTKDINKYQEDLEEVPTFNLKNFYDAIYDVSDEISKKTGITDENQLREITRAALSLYKPDLERVLDPEELYQRDITTELEGNKKGIRKGLMYKLKDQLDAIIDFNSSLRKHPSKMSGNKKEKIKRELAEIIQKQRSVVNQINSLRFKASDKYLEHQKKVKEDLEKDFIDLDYDYYGIPTGGVEPVSKNMRKMISERSLPRLHAELKSLKDQAKKITSQFTEFPRILNQFSEQRATGEGSAIKPWDIAVPLSDEKYKSLVKTRDAISSKIKAGRILVKLDKQGKFDSIRNKINNVAEDIRDIGDYYKQNIDSPAVEKLINKYRQFVSMLRFILEQQSAKSLWDGTGSGPLFRGDEEYVEAPGIKQKYDESGKIPKSHQHGYEHLYDISLEISPNGVAEFLRENNLIEWLENKLKSMITPGKKILKGPPFKDAEKILHSFEAVGRSLSDIKPENIQRKMMKNIFDRSNFEKIYDTLMERKDVAEEGRKYKKILKEKKSSESYRTYLNEDVIKESTLDTVFSTSYEGSLEPISSIIKKNIIRMAGEDFLKLSGLIRTELEKPSMLGGGTKKPKQVGKEVKDELMPHNFLEPDYVGNFITELENNQWNFIDSLAEDELEHYDESDPEQKKRLHLFSEFRQDGGIDKIIAKVILRGEKNLKELIRNRKGLAENLADRVKFDLDKKRDISRSIDRLDHELKRIKNKYYRPLKKLARILNASPEEIINHAVGEKGEDIEDKRERLKALYEEIKRTPEEEKQELRTEKQLRLEERKKFEDPQNFKKILNSILSKYPDTPGEGLQIDWVKKLKSLSDDEIKEKINDITNQENEVNKKISNLSSKISDEEKEIEDLKKIADKSKSPKKKEEAQNQIESLSYELDKVKAYLRKLQTKSSEFKKRSDLYKDFIKNRSEYENKKDIIPVEHEPNWLKQLDSLSDEDFVKNVSEKIKQDVHLSEAAQWKLMDYLENKDKQIEKWTPDTYSTEEAESLFSMYKMLERQLETESESIQKDGEKAQKLRSYVNNMDPGTKEKEKRAKEVSDLDEKINKSLKTHNQLRLLLKDILNKIDKYNKSYKKRTRSLWELVKAVTTQSPPKFDDIYPGITETLKKIQTGQDGPEGNVFTEEFIDEINSSVKKLELIRKEVDLKTSYINHILINMRSSNIAEISKEQGLKKDDIANMISWLRKSLARWTSYRNMITNVMINTAKTVTKKLNELGIRKEVQESLPEKITDVSKMTETFDPQKSLEDRLKERSIKTKQEYKELSQKERLRAREKMWDVQLYRQLGLAGPGGEINFKELNKFFRGVGGKAPISEETTMEQKSETAEPETAETIEHIKTEKTAVAAPRSDKSFELSEYDPVQHIRTPKRYEEKPMTIGVEDWDILEELYRNNLDKLEGFKDLRKKGQIVLDTNGDLNKIHKINDYVWDLENRFEELSELRDTRIKIDEKITNKGKRKPVTIKLNNVGKQFNRLFSEYISKKNPIEIKLSRLHDQLADINYRVKSFKDLYDEVETTDRKGNKTTTYELKKDALTDREVQTITDNFWRAVYWNLMRKWSSREGKAIFGKKDKPEFETMFITFKNMVGVRSNTTMQKVLHAANRASKTLRYLKKELSDMRRRYKDITEYKKSPVYKELEIRINNLKALTEEKSKMYKLMHEATDYEAKLATLRGILKETEDEELKKLVNNKIKHTEEEKAYHEDKIAKLAAEEADDINNEVDKIEEQLSKQTTDRKKGKPSKSKKIPSKTLKKKESIKPVTDSPKKKTKKKVTKTSYRNDINFNWNAFYGKRMQGKMLEMIDHVLKGTRP